MKLQNILLTTLLLCAGVSQAVTPLARDPYKHFAEMVDIYRRNNRTNTSSNNMRVLNDIIASYEYISRLNQAGQRNIIREHADIKMKMLGESTTIDTLRQTRDALQARIDAQGSSSRQAPRPTTAPTTKPSKKKGSALGKTTGAGTPPAYEEEWQHEFRTGQGLPPAYEEDALPLYQEIPQQMTLSRTNSTGTLDIPTRPASPALSEWEEESPSQSRPASPEPRELGGNLQNHLEALLHQRAQAVARLAEVQSQIRSASGIDFTELQAEEQTLTANIERLDLEVRRADRAVRGRNGENAMQQRYQQDQ